MKTNRPAPQPATPESAPEKRRPMGRLLLFFATFIAAILIIIGLTGLLIYNSFNTPRHEAKAVSGGVTVAPFVSLPEENSFPMGLTVNPDGGFYLTLFGTGAILKVDAQGKTSPFIAPKTQVQAGGSIIAAPDKSLYVVDFFPTDPRQSTGTLKHISPAGDKVTTYGMMPGSKTLSLYAQLAYDAKGNLYITNPSTAEIWRVDPTGTGSVWWTAPSIGNTRAQPIGLAYDASRNALVVGDAGTGTVYRVVIADNSAAGSSSVLYRQTGMLVQGLALDDQNRALLLIWLHNNGQLLRLEDNGSANVMAEGFRWPTAIVYRDNKAYVVNSDVIGLVPPLFFGLIPSPLRAKPPFTVDVVDLSAAVAPISVSTPSVS
ncbi:MAG: hypothetical protein IT324_32570 [Anaerolineae bacterium]|nr:hypothetical protein [Anaerolineae bacterium]